MYFILALLLFYSVSLHADLSFMGYTDTSPWYTLFTYSLVHLSFLHLLLNSFVIYSYWRVFRIHLRCMPVILLVAFVSAAAALLSAGSIPTVGSSSIGYSMIAIYMALYNTSKIEKGRLFFLVFMSFLIPSLFAPHINTLNHITSFGIAFPLARLLGKWIVRR